MSTEAPVQSSPALLVVDDEPRVLAALKEVLERQGFHVTAATDPRRALELLGQRPFAAVLSDHLMPDMSGLEFLVECKRIQPLASRVLITAALSLPTLVDAINKGEIYRFLAKPWLREELIATVRNATGRYELLMQNARLSAETAELNRRLAASNEALAEQVRRLEQQRKALDAANQQLAARFNHSLELCTRILSIYDPQLAGQTRTLATIAGQMAADESFLPEERDALRAAGWLCDLGLIGVPRETVRVFLNDPGRLSPEALAAVHNHPVYSQTLAAHLDDRPLLGETIRAHHECFDGSGYPDGLSGDAIPWPARCLAVAVWFVESGYGRERALAAIEEEAGRAFDPKAVRVFLTATQLKNLPRPARQVALDELRPGMVLASGIYSPHGLLLVGEGQELTPATIAKIRNHQLVDPYGPGLLVYT